MKRLFFYLAFMVGAVAALSFTTTRTKVTAHYLSASSCTPSALTNEDGCSITGQGNQCTVNVAGNPPAWNRDDCNEALSMP